MRIYILSVNETFFHPHMFHRILQRHKDAIVGAALFPAPSGFSAFGAMRKCLRIDGWRALPKAVNRWGNRRIDRITGGHGIPACVPDVFSHFGIPVDFFNSPNDNDCIKKINSLDVDIIFNNQPKILREDALKAAKLLCLNKHTSMLPEYRGVEPVFHALLNGDKTIGVTIHSMTEDIDAGAIYAQEEIIASRSVFDCYKRAFDIGPELFGNAIANVEQNRRLGIVDPHNSAYYKRPTDDEIMRFRAKGLSYL